MHNFIQGGPVLKCIGIFGCLGNKEEEEGKKGSIDEEVGKKGLVEDGDSH